MDKKKGVRIFNNLADNWDSYEKLDENLIKYFLDCSNIKENSTILDLGCGSGRIFPYFLERKVKKIVGIDIASKMIEKAKQTYFNHKNIELINADIDIYEDMQEKFDCIFIFDSFNHFSEPEKLLKKLNKWVNNNGIITICEPLSREKCNKYHRIYAKEYSIDLLHEDEFEKIFERMGFKVIHKINEKDKFLICAKKCE